MHYFKKGNGEMIGFAIVGTFVASLFLFFIAFLQYASAMNAVNQGISALSRGAAICGTESDAKKQVKLLKDQVIRSSFLKKHSVRVKIEYAESGPDKEKWQNGNYIKVTVKAKLKTLAPYIMRKSYKKSYIVAIEGASDEKAIEVMRNIIYAVESGGQVYGGRNYANFEMPGANTSSEKYITIGAGCWYGIEAKQYLQYVQSKYGNTVGNISAILAAWNTVQYGSAYKQEIINIMTTPQGRACQDEFMALQIKEYFKEAERKGVTDVGGKMEYMNIRHQGGEGAANRLMAKAEKPYTADSFYRAMQGDSGNQVGAYKSRQNMVIQAIHREMGI